LGGKFEVIDNFQVKVCGYGKFSRKKSVYGKFLRENSWSGEIFKKKIVIMENF